MPLKPKPIKNNSLEARVSLAAAIQISRYLNVWRKIFDVLGLQLDDNLSLVRKIWTKRRQGGRGCGVQSSGASGTHAPARAVERDDKPLGSAEGRDAMWHCHEIIVKDASCGDK